MECSPDPEKSQNGPNLLCLRCRNSGHRASDCPSTDWECGACDPPDAFSWFRSEERRAFRLGSTLGGSDQELCKRCQDLDILQLLQNDLPWETVFDLNKLDTKGMHSSQSIGKVGTIEFWDTCQLCICLFAMTPSPNRQDQDVLLVCDWSMNRLAGESPIVKDLEGWNKFAKCLLVTLSDKSNTMEFSTRIHRGDALCVVEEDDPGNVLGGRYISPNRFPFGIVKEWVSSCVEFHSTQCQPVWTQDLPDIKLVDVLTRKIVRPPQGTLFDYLTLSYVWGGVTQTSFQLGSVLEGTVPQTIEDAIDLVRTLGKQYLWVDSLCIDQSDDIDKEKQIMTMKDVYAGAYMTIIALSGTSADAGLPRVKESKNMFPQLTCFVNGKRLVGLMPTLSQHIWISRWGKRAWTLQEALLSPRCLYISDFQLYFECNGMQCCESLNDSRSWAHHFSVEASPAQGEVLASKVGHGCLRNPIDLPSHRLDRYAMRITLYSYRSMTNPADGLNAISGLLKALETMYTKSFYCGLPIEDFHWGLVWRSPVSPKRRLGFPSWSWAGWQGGLWQTYPFDRTKTNEHPLHLRMWRMLNKELVQFFQTEHFDRFQNDPLTGIADIKRAIDFDILQFPDAEQDNYLFIEAIVFEFVLDFKKRMIECYNLMQQRTFACFVRDVPCYIMIMSGDTEVDKPADPDPKQFVLATRDYSKEQGLVYHHLLMVNMQGEICVRGTQLSLVVPADRLDVLQDFQPRKRRLVIA